MPDQAEKLRRMASTAPPPTDPDCGGPPWLVVTSGKAGAGATTVAVNVAAAMADSGLRIVLVDGSQSQQMRSYMQHTRPNERESSLAISSGPSGTRMLTPAEPPDSDPRTARRRQQELLARMRTLQSGTDVFVVDAGAGLTSWTRRFWRQARLVLVVTTPADTSVMSSYATIKQAANDAVATLGAVINQCDRLSAAGELHRRLSSSCERFLGRPVVAMPALPLHADAGGDARRLGPQVWQTPNSPFGHAVLWLGRAVTELVAAEMVVPG